MSAITHDMKHKWHSTSPNTRKGVAIVGVVVVILIILFIVRMISCANKRRNQVADSASAWSDRSKDQSFSGSSDSHSAQSQHGRQLGDGQRQKAHAPAVQPAQFQKGGQNVETHQAVNTGALVGSSGSIVAPTCGGNGGCKGGHTKATNVPQANVAPAPTRNLRAMRDRRQAVQQGTDVPAIHTPDSRIPPYKRSNRPVDPAKVARVQQARKRVAAEKKEEVEIEIEADQEEPIIVESSAPKRLSRFAPKNDD